MKRAIVGVLLLAAVAGLAGCTASTDAPGPAASPASTAPAVQAVVPVAPATADADSAKTETERLANAIEALIDPSLILHIDKHAQLNDASEGSGQFYGILLTISLEPSVDPITTAKSIVATMESSTWSNQQSTDSDGVYLTALASKPGWFVLVGGDSSTAGQSVLTLQLASPDL